MGVVDSGSIADGRRGENSVVSTPGEHGAERTLLPARSTTGEQVADLVREEILSGEISRGAALREELISERYKVSRRTVRDALRVLESEGLVRHQRHKGSTVVDFSAEDIADIYCSREVLEVDAAKRWCTSDGPTGGHRFDQLTVAIDQLERASRGTDFRRIVQADLNFHAAIIGLLDSPRIDRFFNAIESEMLYALAILEASSGEYRDDAAQAFGEHRAIYRALEARNEQLSTRLVAEHLEANRNILIHIVAS
ncbi:GntR family transcriptional regulator [Rhodococcus fascians]|nr:GntR family transcriptional regulator [Rhodococcus fascians]MBY4140898.1 GntR family transcriptional regulator [Rhodococcus fascians]MBY4219562.1 GntR family transcriptional regulator [Rhodococcus fascians]MBY4221871.1 GntR family transcriptional regulator [Rhodococcus fascians]MBY4233872.1 GntR family transcriptional regulator [Rhodococcus fascians]